MISAMKLQRIQSLQDRAINFIRTPKDKYLQTSKVYQKYKILKIKDVINVELLKFVYNFCQNSLLKYLLELHLISNPHSHNTQFKTLKTLLVKKAVYQNSFIVKGNKLWNETPDTIKNSNTWNACKNRFKKAILLSY